MRENRPAQLQQQLVQKGTGLSSVKKELAYLQQELSQTHQAKYEATKVQLVLHLHHDKKHPAYGSCFVLLQLLALHQHECCAEVSFQHWEKTVAA